MSDSQRRFWALTSWAFSTATAAEEASEPSVTSSSIVNSPAALLIAWKTPMTAPSCPVIASVRRLRVRKPVRLSFSGLNRGSAYASGMLIVSPVFATVPAMPTPNGNRISPTPWPIATRDQYSCFSWSTM